MSATDSNSDVQRERALIIDALKLKIFVLHPVVQQTLVTRGKRICKAASRGDLPNFLKGELVLIARDRITAGQKLLIRYRGPRRVFKAFSNYVYQFKDLCNDQFQEVHCTHLKLHRDSSLSFEAIRSHVIKSETGMLVQRFMSLVDTDNGLVVRVCWRGSPKSEDTIEPVARVYEDLPKLFKKLLAGKNAPIDLALKRVVISASEKRVCDVLYPSGIYSSFQFTMRRTVLFYSICNRLLPLFYG